jgi:hypothetical protein
MVASMIKEYTDSQLVNYYSVMVGSIITGSTCTILDVIGRDYYVLPFDYSYLRDILSLSISSEIVRSIAWYIYYELCMNDDSLRVIIPYITLIRADNNILYLPCTNNNNFIWMRSRIINEILNVREFDRISCSYENGLVYSRILKRKNPTIKIYSSCASNGVVREKWYPLPPYFSYKVPSAMVCTFVFPRGTIKPNDDEIFPEMQIIVNEKINELSRLELFDVVSQINPIDKLDFTNNGVYDLVGHYNYMVTSFVSTTFTEGIVHRFITSGEIKNMEENMTVITPFRTILPYQEYMKYRQIEIYLCGYNIFYPIPIYGMSGEESLTVDISILDEAIIGAINQYNNVVHNFTARVSVGGVKILKLITEFTKALRILWKYGYFNDTITFLDRIRTPHGQIIFKNLFKEHINTYEDLSDIGFIRFVNTCTSIANSLIGNSISKEFLLNDLL